MSLKFELNQMANSSISLCDIKTGEMKVMNDFILDLDQNLLEMSDIKWHLR